MPDDDTPLAERIAVDDEDRLRAWARRLDVSPEQLKDAVRIVGNRADEVEMHLKGTRVSANADREARAHGSLPR